MIAMLDTQYPLHLLGWKAFQDFSVSVAEECLRRPVQTFLPTKDAGRDGAFIGKWDGEEHSAGESTIQCKFTSKPNHNLTLSLLEDELQKAKSLASKGLAADYIILTNHPITGASDIAIKAAFEGVGVGRCRVFGYDFLVRQIKTSPRLRMMSPRLYGLGDLSDLLDSRAYEQTQLILSAMGDDLQRLVVTDAHRQSVRAISEHNLVLLLGAPAAGKSTIGASLAVGAADIWQCPTIRATSPEEVKQHLNPNLAQFFWIDDAWGSTQYQNQVVEAWNKVFPLMQGAMHKGTRFLITSRDYIWNAAKLDLKIQALPVLGKSQVVINVQELKHQEKAQILYNHLKMGDQPQSFRKAVKEFLPEIAELKDFLPETARRFGSVFFAQNTYVERSRILKFFKEPQEFLQQTIANLSPDCKAAIATVFMNGGKVRSPIPQQDFEPAAQAYGVTLAAVRLQMEALNGSLLLAARDEQGVLWRYKHPTVGDAFAKHVGSDPELVEIYLRGAKPESLVSEVVCAGIELFGASIVIPDSLHWLLADRLKMLDVLKLKGFLTQRSNPLFSGRMLNLRPDVQSGMTSFLTPIKDDSDATLLATFHQQGLLSEELRTNFVDAVRNAAIQDADASFLEDPLLGAVLTNTERESILQLVQIALMPNIESRIKSLRTKWDSDYPPDDYFDEFENSIKLFTEALPNSSKAQTMAKVKAHIWQEVSSMYEKYDPPSPTSAPTSMPTPASGGLSSVFRDIDE
jgi:hypothetical protein